MSGQDSTCTEKSKGLIDNFKVGFDVWMQEIKGIFSRLLGNFEVRQLEKRLEKEYALLGKLICDDAKGDSELCRKQIDFFKDEISKLKKEQAAKRDVKHRDNKRKMDL
ncbi:hypothetical protein [Maridesulfovibrio hydrothermalis]|uniref:Uncharacterized protein n=1 Tax=Maridesulfovibrio hydrothermalis AM13 = DSM 14728 TaxID=1121451 RepID=L0R8T7_9BACT|nr:hypothetical protein [Maridesulfovibrio hydrothermalis]CCO23174.1 conserved protein of unknown function [Maridesulfovibrio hydrothermalis AM13 = DSM 14728]